MSCPSDHSGLTEAEDALVIGHGRMGRRHVRVLRTLGMRVLTVDPLAPADATSLADLASSPPVVCIATPIADLAAVAHEVLERWTPRLIYIEKPGAQSAEDLLVLGSTAHAAGVRVFIGYTERHNPVILELARRCDEGVFPTIKRVGARRYSPDITVESPEVLLDLAVHDLDLAIGLGLDGAWDIDVGFAPTKVRIWSTVHDDGSINILDLDKRLLNGELIDGQEPLERAWLEALHGPPRGGQALLSREAAVLRAVADLEPDWVRRRVR